MKSNLVYIVLAGLLLLIGNGLFKAPPQSEPYPEIGTCELIDTTTLKLIGPIDGAMHECAIALMTPDIEIIRITTQGGDVFAGRAIGYIIGEQPRHLIVDKMCLSSCGNYFVPAAARVSLRPGSVIGLHGTPDPHMLSNAEMENHMASMIEDGNVASEGISRILKRKFDRRETQLLEETKFAAHFNVPKGWRMYREAGDADDGWRRQFTTGSDADVIIDNFMIVEGPMLTSCLPHVKTENYQSTLDDTVFKNTKFWAALTEQMGAYRSRGLACRPIPSPQ